MARLKKDYPDSKVLDDLRDVQLPAEDRVVGKLPVQELHEAKQYVQKESGEVKVAETKKENVLPTSRIADPASRSGGKYALQVGAFSTTANAEKQKAFFEKLGYQVQLSSKVMGNKGLYLVWVGSYKNEAEAKRESEQIKRKYKINSMLVAR